MTPFTENYANQYDRLYRDKDYAAECDFLETLFAQAATPVRRILDLGCGTGGHALPLAQRGLHVTGVDLSAGMLAFAQTRRTSSAWATASRCITRPSKVSTAGRRLTPSPASLPC
jgi:predicted TPR repeat methyltransferase